MMAASGQIQTDTAFGYIKLSWTTLSQSIENNTSAIAYTLSIYRHSDVDSTAAKSYSIALNGVTVASGATTIGGNGTKTIKSGTTIIPHNTDGTKTFSLSFSQQIDITYSGSWIGTVTGNGSGTLNAIPRATTPTLSTNIVIMGNALTITLNRASASFTHTLIYSFGSVSETIGSSIGASYTWTVPLALANQIPAAVSGVGTITCETYYGATLIGTKSIPFIATIPASVIPAISNVVITEAVTNPDIATKFNAFVQHNSKLNIAVTAAGTYGSTIQSCKITLYDASDNAIASYFGTDVITDTLPISGTIKIGISITDSRGRSASASYSKTVLPYNFPQIAGFSAFRCNSDGTANYDGQCANVAVNFSIATVNNLNDKHYEILYKVKGASSWAGTLASGNIYSRNDSFITDAAFDSDDTYEITIKIGDFFVADTDSVNATLQIPPAFTLIDCRSTGKGIAFGKASTKDCMEIALDVDLSGGLMQEERQTPTLQRSWINYGGDYEVASYWKDKCGVVHIAGLIKSGVTTAETVIFTLPENYRPRASEKFFTISSNAVCIIEVHATGDVVIKAGANSNWLSLSGITFRIT